MDLFPLRDVIRPLYWADNSSDFRVNARPPFLQAKSHTCDLINLSHSNSALAVLLPADDPDHPTVLYFLDEPVAWKLHAAGRLDIDTTGLVLMTDDGQWSHRITSPRHHCEKTYLVTLESPVADDTAEQFAKGVQLHNEKDLTKPAVLEVITPTQVRLTISEGRYHQVKRMFAAVGNHVVELHRERIGGITLDADLAPGEYRPLTEEEIASVV